MTRVIRKTAFGLALLTSIVVSTLSLSVAEAKNIKRQNLLELLTHTDSILVGTVAKQEDGFQDGLPYTEITVSVGQSIKGSHGPTYSFRQFGLMKPKSMGDGRVNLMVTPAGWPRYADGEQVMLFLHKPAAETGFQTTAGLTQGKFLIRGSEISNDINNEALFSRLSIQGTLTPAHQDLVNQPGGAYATEDFLSLIKTAVEEKWIENGVLTNAK